MRAGIGVPVGFFRGGEGASVAVASVFATPRRGPNLRHLLPCIVAHGSLFLHHIPRSLLPFFEHAFLVDISPNVSLT